MRALVAILSACVWLQAQDFADHEVLKAAEDNTFAEGPAWSPEGYLVFSDVPSNRIWKLDTGEEPEILRGDSEGASGNAFDARGRLYTCESRGRRLVRQNASGRVEVVADEWEGKRLNGPNDVVVRRDGHIYFTDPAFGSASDTRELDFNGVFHVTGRGQMELVGRYEGRPNGIALSPDGRTLYVAISDDRQVRAYDLDGEGKASGERLLVDGIDGPPDGMTVDEKGNLYVAANDLAVYTAEGELLGTVKMPEKPSNCAFGGPDFETLYVTARTTVYAIRLGVKGVVQR